MDVLYQHTKQGIRDELRKIGHRFGLVSDMWSEGTDKYLGLFAMYQVDGKVTRRLLSCMVREDLGDGAVVDVY